MLKKADIFPANPKWSINGKEFGSTWKTVILTVLIVVGGFFMSINDIQQLWIDKSQLQLQESSGSAVGQMADPFIMGVQMSDPNSYGNVIANYSSGEVIPRADSCPQDLLNIDNTMVCYNIRSCLLTDNDTLLVYSNGTDPYVMMTLYLEMFSQKSILQDRPNPFKRIPITYTSAQTNLTITKQKLILSNSLVPGSKVQNFVGLDYQADITSAIPIYLSLTRFSFNDATVMPIYSVTRETIAIILASYISSIQLLAGILGILMIMINSLYLKMELAKRIYDNPEIRDVRVSYLFTIKMVLLSGLTMVKLHSWALRKGWFKTQYVCSKAFDDLDEKLSVENVLKGIQTIKQNKLREKDTMLTKDDGAILEFDYNLATDADSMLTDIDRTKSKIKNKLVPSRSTKKKSLIGNILRALESSPVQIEFGVDKSQKSSVLSTVATYLGIGGLIFVLIYLNSFNFQTNINDFSIFDNSSTIFNFSQQPIAFTITMDPGNIMLYTPADANMSVSINSTDTSSYNLVYNCTPPNSAFPNHNYATCFTENPHFSPNNDIFINITQTQVLYSMWIDFQVLDSFPLQDDYATRYYIQPMQLVPFDPPTTFTYTFQKMMEIHDGRRREFFRLIQTELKYTVNPVAQDCMLIILRLSDKSRQRVITEVTITDIFLNVWGLNLLFFLVMALYISRPYNRQVAKKMLGKKFTHDEIKSKDKGQHILHINNFLLYLRSKIQTIDQNSFFKENLMPVDLQASQTY